jgi:hypothetical protein
MSCTRSVRDSVKGRPARHARGVYTGGGDFHVPDEDLKVSAHVGLRAVRGHCDPCRAQGLVHQQEVAAKLLAMLRSRSARVFFFAITPPVASLSRHRPLKAPSDRVRPRAGILLTP